MFLKKMKPVQSSNKVEIRPISSMVRTPIIAIVWDSHLDNYFGLHACLSFRPSIRQSVRHTFIFFHFLQSFHKITLIKVAWHVVRVKNMHLGSPSDPSGTAAAEAKPRRV